MVIFFFFLHRLETWENPWFLRIFPPARLQESIFLHWLCIYLGLGGSIFQRWHNVSHPTCSSSNVTYALLWLCSRVCVPSPWNGLLLWLPRSDTVTFEIGHKHAKHFPLALLDSSHSTVRKFKLVYMERPRVSVSATRHVNEEGFKMNVASSNWVTCRLWNFSVKVQTFQSRDKPSP